jgi:hypothetical protein
MYFFKPLANGLDRFRQSGSSSGEPDHAHAAKPFRLQVFRTFDVPCSLAPAATGFD